MADLFFKTKICRLAASTTEARRLQALGRAIHKRFSVLGGVDLSDRPRDPIRVTDFSE